MAESVPGWDGNPRGWRRYSREVTWFVLGTKKASRPFLAPRLISKLTGPARLLAMSWSQQDFKGTQGVRLLLQRLAESPLVRKNLPNTSAVLNQYFNYKRYPQESIANYLVRESLYYEEFSESLMALKDEQDGVPAQVFPDFSDASSSGMRRMRMKAQSLRRRKKATRESLLKILKKKDLPTVFLEGVLLLHRGDLRRDRLVELRLVEV